VAGAKNVHYFFIENDEKQKSRYVEKSLWKKQKKEKETDENKYIKKSAIVLLSRHQTRPISPRQKKSSAISTI